ncbi:MAG: hypothetical protein HY299_11475 [Verrucomicrobia bacterium]|nr:hypothetical protein [Verrucomicrobiota bacterium]
MRLRLQQPFPYNPSKGNLLLEYRNYSGLPVRLHTDSISLSGGPGAMVYADGNPDAALAGGGAPGADIITLVYSIQDNVAPIVTEWPHPLAVIDGGLAEFNASAVGTTPLGYQWFLNENALDQQTSQFLRFSATTTGSAGSYRVRIRNNAGEVTSSEAPLLVFPKPVGTQVVPPENATLEGSGVSAALSLPLRQQELYDSSLFAPEPIQITQIRYRLDGLLGAKQGGFGVFLSNATVRLSTTAKRPGELDFRFEDNYGPDLTEAFHGDWLVSAKPFPLGSVPPHDFDIILQLSSPFLYDPTVGNLLVETVMRDHSPLLISQDSAAPNGKTQRIFIQDPNSTLAAIGDSSAAVILVGYSPAKIAPRIFTQPASHIVLEGDPVEFNVTASGARPLSYQWSFNGHIVTDATQSVFRLDHAYLGNAGTFSVVVSNEFGTLPSAEARLTITPLPAEVVIGSVFAASGQHFTITVVLHSHGNENGLSFGLRFTRPLLALEGVELTGLAQDPIVNINTNAAETGSMGLALILSEGRTFPAGTNVLALLHFRAAPSLSNQIATLEFVDEPIVREVVDVLANPLPANFVEGTASILFRGFEADVTPRQSPDRRITLSDWVQVGRFVAGLDDVASSDEFQRVDNAPIETAGDGRLSVMDWVQAGRFADGFDTPVLLGGPTNEVQTAQSTATVSLQDATTRQLRVASVASHVGEEVRVPVTFLAEGGEAAIGFSLKFDCGVVQLLRLEQSSDVSGMVVNLNTRRTFQGLVGVAFGFPTGGQLSVGTKTLGTLVFKVIAKRSPVSALDLGNVPVVREVVDSAARALSTTYQNGSIAVTGELTELRITARGGVVEVAWPIAYGDLILEMTNDLSSNKWAPVGVAKSVSGSSVTVEVPVAAGVGAYYFRAVAP